MRVSTSPQHLSVFEALPEHYKVKISESYAREKAKGTPALVPKHKETSTVVLPAAQETNTVVNTHDDDAVNVATVFAYLREWLYIIQERMVMFNHSVNM